MSSGPPPVPGGRTPEDREAARRWREARRAGRSDDGFRGTRSGPPRRRRTPIRLAVATAAGLLLVAVAWFLLSLFQPFKGSGDTRVRVAVPAGAGVGEIADLLERRGIVASSFFFELRARLSGKSGDLKPGSYVLRRDMSYGAALDKLVKGPPPNIVVVVVPEGRSRREIAATIPGSLHGDYLAATRRSPALDPHRYGAPRSATLEGFLFPATYQLKKGQPVSRLVDEQLSAFRTNFPAIDLRYARSKKLTPYDVLIIASLVEREATLPRDRPLIASVMYNRLHEGLRLDIDATVRFVTGNWNRPLRASELRDPSPYNTRLHRGLPPGPIGNPGLASLRAAAHPARTRYLYYVVKPGTCGEHQFARTKAQFQRYVDQYDRARARRGGRSPTRC